MLKKILQIDTDLFLFFNSQHLPILDTIMWQISGKYFWIPLYLFIVFFILKSDFKKGIISLIFIIAAVAISDLLSVVMFKDVFQRLRPSHEIDLQSYIHLVNNYRGGKYGFVSSHAANSFAISTSTALLFKNKSYTVLIMFWALLVCYSRIYLGVHYPLDIIFGGLLGVAVSILLMILYKKIIKFIDTTNHAKSQSR